MDSNNKPNLLSELENLRAWNKEIESKEEKENTKLMDSGKQLRDLICQYQAFISKLLYHQEKCDSHACYQLRDEYGINKKKGHLQRESEDQKLVCEELADATSQYQELQDKLAACKQKTDSNKILIEGLIEATIQNQELKENLVGFQKDSEEITEAISEYQELQDKLPAFQKESEDYKIVCEELADATSQDQKLQDTLEAWLEEAKKTKMLIEELIEARNKLSTLALKVDG